MKLVSTSPSRNFEVIGEVQTSTEKEIKNAVLKAKKGYRTWVRLSIKERCTLLDSFIKISKNRFEEIARLIAKETGRPIVSARANVSGGIQYLKAYVAMAEKDLAPQMVFKTDKETHRVCREPWGIVASICPWNYPFMNVAWQCGQALIAGNTIVYKNSEENPLFAKLLSEIMKQSNIPEGVFNVIYGDGATGDILVHQDINMISFTGSTQVGQYLSKVAAEKFIPIVTELGGSSPGIIFADVNITSIIDYIYDRRFKNAGQACDAVKRLIIHKSKLNEVVEKLCQVISGKKIGDVLDEDTDIGPLVAKKQFDLLEEQMRDALKKGAKIKIGGHKPKNLHGAYYLPTVLTNILPSMRVWKEEVFGPVLPIVPFTTEREAISLANDTEYGLSAHVFTNDKKLFDRVASQLKAGSIAQNKVGYWDPRNPFGGYKKSGMGRIHGQFGFDDFTQIKLVSKEK